MCVCSYQIIQPKPGVAFQKKGNHAFRRLPTGLLKAVLSSKILFFLFVSAAIISQCVLSFDSFAQIRQIPNNENRYRSVHWTIFDGLSQGRNCSLLKDVNGFLWVGSDNGLNRFDGSLFKVYYHNQHNSKTISGNYIQSMVEDSLHNIWIGTDLGLSRYDIKADSFTNFTAKPEVDFDASFTPFWATRDEIFSFESGATALNFRITVVNIHSFTIRRIGNLSAVKEGLLFGIGIPNSIYDEKSNSVWMLWGSDRTAGGGLMNVSLADGKRQTFGWSCYRNIPGHSHVADGMRFDRNRNSIWINSTDGLVEFTLVDKQFHRIAAMDRLVKLKDYDRSVGIDVDIRGRVWLATAPKGVLIYDPADQSLTMPFPKDSAQQHEVSDANSIIYCGKDGIVWTGFWKHNGIYQIIPFSPIVTVYSHDPKNPNSLNNNATLNILNAGHGKLWIETIWGRINILDTKTGNINELKENDFQGLKHEGYTSPGAIDLLSDKAWVETPSCEFEINLTTKQLHPIFFVDSTDHLIKFPGYGIHLPFKNKWLSVIHFSGDVFMLDQGSDTARAILSIPTYAFNDFSTCTDEDHLLFLRGLMNGNLTYSLMNNKWKRIPHAMDSIQWTCIYFNKKDASFWVAADRQLIHYDKEFTLIHIYNQDNGLPELEISSMIADDRGNIWFHTDRSIGQLDVKSGEISILSEKDGFQKQDFCLVKCSQKDDNGDIYFSGGLNGNGVTRINPDNYTNPPSSVYLQSLEVNQKPFPPTTGINYLKELNLSHLENNINIALGVIDYYSKGTSRIRYKIERNGSEGKWQYVSANYVVHLENLQPGKYNFRMQASNAALQFNGPEKDLSIQITPAYWNTWWFRAIAALCIAMIFYLLIRWRVQQKFRLQLERSTKEQQLSELRHKTSELEMQALRAQMNPHFIFNSLNSINRFILQNNKTQASAFLTKFSKLVRLILQNSQATLISLESELESLELYLQLEALRFNYHFRYKISVLQFLDTSALKLPPLIIQPYVENAIWHGLMHKEDEGQLDIEVSQEGQQLFFKITDNGIGRKTALAFASKSATRHKSMGLKITADRIAMLESNSEDESPITIQDLINADGSAGGTEVLIKIPVKYD